MKTTLLALIFGIFIGYLTSLGGVVAFTNSTCIDANTLQVNTSTETLINSNWFNVSRTEYFYCPLGCTSVEGPKCREIVPGSTPIEIFILLEIIAFILLFITFRNYDNEESKNPMIYPLLALIFFFALGTMSFSITTFTGGVISNMVLVFLNFGCLP